MTKYATIQNDKEFSTIARQFKDSQGKANERLQALIEYGIQKAQEHNDTSLLSQALNIAMGIKMVGTKAVKEYIQAHINVKWLKTTDGTYKFKRDGKEWTIKEIEVPFWDHSSAAKVAAKVDMLDPVKELQAVFGKLINAKKKGKMPETRVALFDDLLGRVQDVLKDVKPMTKDELKALTA